MSDTAPARFSLQRRLLLGFALMLMLFLGLVGLSLDRSFKSSIQVAAQERLRLQIYALLAVAEPDNGQVFVPDLEDTRFQQIDSGLYAMILGQDGTELWRSASALNLASVASLRQALAPVISLQPGQDMLQGEWQDPALGPLFYTAYAVQWAGQNQVFRVLVLESTAPATQEIRQFQSSLWWWLGGISVLLVFSQLTLLRWGLRPLQQLASDVEAIERGERSSLQGHYPQELVPLADNMNLLIQSERARQARYQRTLGDLAHSLKTPLAVIDGLVSDAGSARAELTLAEIHEQTQRMNQIVSYQLKRAVQSSQHAWLLTPVPVAPVLEKLLRALAKVYRERELQIEQELSESAQFFGEESDFMEVAGNLIDNACKYSQRWVRVRCGQDEGRLWLQVEDDGPGIPPERQRWVLQRGARADTVKSGQGIGLAVATEIISHYRGQLSFSARDAGGTSVRVEFPPPATP